MTESPSPANPVDAFGLPLASLAGASRDAVMLVDAGQQIVAANAWAQRLFGHAAGALVGRPLAQLMPEPQRAALAMQLQTFAESGRSEGVLDAEHALLGQRADGQVFPLEVSLSRVEFTVGRRPRAFFLLMMRDLGVELAQRSELGTLTGRLRAMLDLAPVGLWIVEHERVVYANRAALQLFGVPATEDLVGYAIDSLLHADSADTLAKHLAQALQGGATVQLASTLTRRDGQVRQIEIATTALPDHGSTVLQMAITDMTQQLAQARDQAQHQLELRRLAASVAEAREEERRRIARELHDELGQRLSALKMALAGLRSDPSPAGRRRPQDDGQPLADMLEMVDNTVAALRRIATDLRPLMLDDLGLYAAIEWLARDAAHRMDVEVTVRLDGEDPPPLAPGADIALYRMVQEALTNVGRHANATDVRIGLQRSGDTLVLTVHDNGKGFPERAAQHDDRYGLLGIRERAFMLGGRLEIDNPPGGGGRLTVHLPLQTAVRPAETAA